MTNNVTRLKPRLGSYEMAVDAYASGDFSLSLELTSRLATPVASILRARALFRLGNASAALEVIEFQLLGEINNNELAAELSVLRVFGLYWLGRPVEAAEFSVEARAQCVSAGLPAIEAELAIAAAVGALVEQDYLRAAELADAVLDVEDSNVAWVKPSTYRYTLAFWRSRACDFRATIEYAHANEPAREHWLRRSFEEFDKSGVGDDYLESKMLENYADIGLDLSRVSVAEFVTDRASRIRWNSCLVESEFRVYKLLAEAASNTGDHLGALRFFRRCRECAPSAPLQISANLERSRLFREIGEFVSAQEEIDLAARLTKNVDWETVDEVDQHQLLLLAAQVSAFDAGEAAHLLARFDGLKKHSGRAIIIRNDRIRGQELVARAAVLRAVGNSDRAIVLLLDALNVWSVAGYVSSAAIAAAELAELTDEPHYVEIARKQCEKQPNSLLARKMARYDERKANPLDFNSRRLTYSVSRS